MFMILNHYTIVVLYVEIEHEYTIIFFSINFLLIFYYST